MKNEAIKGYEGEAKTTPPTPIQIAVTDLFIPLPLKVFDTKTNVNYLKDLGMTYDTCTTAS